MPRLSKKAKQEWSFFLNAETGRRTYIEIHTNEKKHSHNNVKIDIYFTAVGLFSIPTEQELLRIFEETKNEKLLTQKTA